VIPQPPLQTLLPKHMLTQLCYHHFCITYLFVFIFIFFVRIGPFVHDEAVREPGVDWWCEALGGFGYGSSVDELDWLDGEKADWAGG
jgi:hypothetical protein